MRGIILLVTAEKKLLLMHFYAGRISREAKKIKIRMKETRFFTFVKKTPKSKY